MTSKDAVAMKLELVPVPVKDIDAAKAFYAEKLGFTVDVDHKDGNIRVVQLTPRGSACSICLTKGFPALNGEPGSLRSLHLVVEDIQKARQQLVGTGVKMGEIEDLGGGMRYSSFSDPDGNTWTLQQMGGS